MSLPIGIAIKRVRQEKGLMAEVVANRAKISLPCLRKFESGERRVSLDKLESVSAALGVSTWEMVWVAEQAKGAA